MELSNTCTTATGHGRCWCAPATAIVDDFYSPGAGISSTAGARKHRDQSAGTCTVRAYVRALSHVTITFLWSQGWVKSVRKHKRYVFIDLNDGSSLKDLQIVAPVDEFPMYVKL